MVMETFWAGCNAVNIMTETTERARYLRWIPPGTVRYLPGSQGVGIVDDTTLRN
jgi:hypothetical protein